MQSAKTILRLLIYSIVILVVIWVLLHIIVLLGGQPSPQVNFVIPGKNEYHLKEIFPVKIEITDIKTPINLVQSDLSFDPSILEVVDVSLEDSFASIVVQKEWSNDLGYLRVTAGLPNPGFAGPRGTLATAYFRGINPGLSQVKFLDSSLVLANNGRGDNVLQDLPVSSYVILPDPLPDTNQVQSVLGTESVPEHLDYTIYQDDLPKPFANILSTAYTPMPAPTALPAPTRTSPLQRLRVTLAQFDHRIFSFWQSLNH